MITINIIVRQSHSSGVVVAPSPGSDGTVEDHSRATSVVTFVHNGHSLPSGDDVASIHDNRLSSATVDNGHININEGSCHLDESSSTRVTTGSTPPTLSDGSNEANHAASPVSEYPIDEGSLASSHYSDGSPCVDGLPNGVDVASTVDDDGHSLPNDDNDQENAFKRQRIQ